MGVPTDSLKTVPKFPQAQVNIVNPDAAPYSPTRLMTPKMRPDLLLMVRYEPLALPATGFSLVAWSRSSCIRTTEPILSDVAYTENTNVKMMANRTAVCV